MAPSASKLATPAIAAWICVTVAAWIALNSSRKRRLEGGEDDHRVFTSAGPGGRAGVRDAVKRSPRYKKATGKEKWILQPGKTQWHLNFVENADLAATIYWRKWRNCIAELLACNATLPPPPHLNASAAATTTCIPPSASCCSSSCNCLPHPLLGSCPPRGSRCPSNSPGCNNSSCNPPHLNATATVARATPQHVGTKTKDY